MTAIAIAIEAPPEPASPLEQLPVSDVEWSPLPYLGQVLEAQFEQARQAYNEAVDQLAADIDRATARASQQMHARLDDYLRPPLMTGGHAPAETPSETGPEPDLDPAAEAALARFNAAHDAEPDTTGDEPGDEPASGEPGE